MTNISLTLKYMAVIAFTTLFACVVFVFLSTVLVRRSQDKELETALESLISASLDDGTDSLPFVSLPYYVVYTVYSSPTKTVRATNDPLLPLLESRGSCKTYIAKNYFADGDLNIRYLTRHVLIDDTEYIIEVAIDTENDSAVKALKSLPRLALLSLVPVLLISALLSLFISRGVIAEYEKLHSNLMREREFTSNVSHELKTPIAIISAHANLIRRWGKSDSAQLESSIQSIIKASDNMSEIVTTLLELSRIERKSLTLERTSFSVYDFFSDIKKEFTALYRELTINIEENCNVALTTDRAKLHEIFTAIISNSVKFAGKDCTIALSAFCKDKHTILTVSDNGAGFDDKSLTRAFDRFYKADSSHSRKVEGSGLGLAIAKSLTELLGGTIKASNASPHGAVITLEFLL